MLRYYDYAVVFAEIPDEITLAINITGCPHMCKGCHSPHLRDNKLGKDLYPEVIDALVKNHPDVTCICFMGGDNDPSAVQEVAAYIKDVHKLKVGMYSGNDSLDTGLVGTLDYYKVGSYQAERGPLNKRTTNQRLYKITHNREKGEMCIENITSRFWKDSIFS